MFANQTGHIDRLQDNAATQHSSHDGYVFVVYNSMNDFTFSSRGCSFFCGISCCGENEMLSCYLMHWPICGFRPLCGIYILIPLDVESVE